MNSPAAIDEAPAEARALLDLAQAARADGRSDAAMRFWRAAAATAPASAVPYVNLAGAGFGAVWPEAAAAVLAPGDPVVTRNLGVLADRRGDPGLALRRLMRAVALVPEQPSSVAIFSRQSQMRSREPAGRHWAVRAAILAPADIDLQLACVKRLRDAGYPQAAIARARAVRVAPDAWPSELLDLVADIHIAVAEFRAAIPLLGLLIGRHPGDAARRVVAARLHHNVGDLGYALAEARRAVVLEPGSFDATSETATSFCHAERFARAIPWFRRCVRVAPLRRSEVVENYAACLHEVGDGAAGSSLLRRHLAEHPAGAKPYIGLSSLAQAAQDLRRADRYARQSVVIDGTRPEGLYQLASVRRHQGRTAESLAIFDRLRAGGGSKPEQAFVHALVELGEGDPAAGVSAYEARWTVPRFAGNRRPSGPRALGSPVWRGEERPDATLAVWGEQGVGDELWFAGYLAWVTTRVRRVVLEVSPNLVGLLQRSFPAVDVRPRGLGTTEAALAAADFQIPMGGLMLPYGAGAEPVPTGYLRVDPIRVGRLRDRYTGGRSDVRVLGLAWRSVKPHPQSSFEAPMPAWRPIFALPRTVFVSLQYGEVAADARTVGELFGARLVVDGEIDAYRDLDALAAQVAATDCVVSVANSTVAVAHGLGQPVHVLLRAVQEDWRYARRRATSRWLPTARCAWMPGPGEWSQPIAEVADRLRRSTVGS